ncbi:hypothetical protein R1sor_011016 [Riccia sorocarpa]|uniref:Uncharacterized protein n=1 Tax=Riccia sorocarpa TaxID=122646 RepID=A0ABD3I3A8_9MARC
MSTAGGGAQVGTRKEAQSIGVALNSTSDSNPSQPSSAPANGGLVREIQQGKQVVKEKPKGLNYGEMTLEDFLVKAGVVREDSESENPPGSFLTQFPAPLGSEHPYHASSALAPSQATLEAMAHHSQHQQQIEWHNYNSAMQQKLRQQQVQEAAIAAYGMPKRGPVITIPGTPPGSGMEGSSDGGLDQVNGLSPAITTSDTPNP